MLKQTSLDAWFDEFDYSCKDSDIHIAKSGWFPIGRTAICGYCSFIIEGKIGEQLINDYLGDSDPSKF